MQELYDINHIGKSIKFTIPGLVTDEAFTNADRGSISMDALNDLLNPELKGDHKIVGIRIYNVGRVLDDEQIKGCIITAVDAFGNEINDDYYLGGRTLFGGSINGVIINRKTAQLILKLSDKEVQLVSFFSISMINLLKNEAEETKEISGLSFHIVPSLVEGHNAFLAEPLGDVKTVKVSGGGFDFIQDEQKNCIQSDCSSPGFATAEDEVDLIRQPPSSNLLLRWFKEKPYNTDDKGNVTSVQTPKLKKGYLSFQRINELKSVKDCVGVQVIGTTSLFVCPVDSNGHLLENKYLLSHMTDMIFEGDEFMSKRAAELIGAKAPSFVSFYSFSMLESALLETDSDNHGIFFYETSKTSKGHLAAPCRIEDGRIIVRSFQNLVDGIESPFVSPDNEANYALKWSDAILYQ